MKKILILILAVLIAVAVTVLVRFPYGSYLSSQLDSINKSSDVKVSFGSSSGGFPVLKLQHVKIFSPQGMLMELDTLDLKAALGGISFHGAGPSGLTLDGKHIGKKLTFRIKNYRIPQFAAPEIGTGLLDTEGTYDLGSGEGKANFKGVISAFPNPLISGSFNVSGVTTKTKSGVNVTFSAAGNNISGEGYITLAVSSGGKPGQTSGNIKLTAGSIPLNLRVSGEAGAIKLTPSL